MVGVALGACLAIIMTCLAHMACGDAPARCGVAPARFGKAARGGCAVGLAVLLPALLLGWRGGDWPAYLIQLAILAGIRQAIEPVTPQRACPREYAVSS